MNTKTTIIVLLIAIALGAYFVVFESGWLGAPPEDQPTAGESGSGTPLFAAGALKPADVKKLTLEISGRSPIVIERDADKSAGWIQTAPVRIAAKDWTINDLIDSAALLRYTNTLKAENLPDYGLEPAKVTLTLEGTTAGSPGAPGFTHTLKFGRTTAAGQGLLMLDDERQVYAVDAALHRQLIGLDPMMLRSTTLKEIDISRVKRMTLRREGLEVSMAREGNRWRFAGGASGRVDADAAKAMLNTVNFAVIESFHADNPDDPGRYGLAEPRGTLEIEVEQAGSGEEDAEPHTVTRTLRIGSATDLSENKYFATYEPDASGVVFAIARTSADRLNVSIDDLRDPRLTSAIASDLREITVEASGAPGLRFVREEGRWTFGEPKPEFGIEPSAVGQLLDALLLTRAMEFAAIPENSDSESEEEPLATVTLAVAGQTENEVLKIYPHGEDRLLVVRVGEQTGYIVNSAGLAMVFEPVLAYRDYTVWDLKPDEIVGLKLERGGKYPASYELSRPAGAAWDTSGHDADAVDRLLAALTPLRTTGWTEQKVTDADVTLTVTLTDGMTRNLTASTGAKIAAVEDGNFELQPTTTAAMTAELRQRKLIDAGFEQIARVQRGELSVERSAEGLFTILGDPTFDEPMAAQLLETLAALRADHFVSDDWAKIDADNPTITLEIALRDGAMATLRLWSAEATGRDEPVGRIDEGSFFTLNRFDYEILTGETAGMPVEPMK